MISNKQIAEKFMVALGHGVSSKLIYKFKVQAVFNFPSFKRWRVYKNRLYASGYEVELSYCTFYFKKNALKYAVLKNLEE